MATGAYIVEKALRKIGVAAAESPVTAFQLSDGVDVLNDMLSTWEPLVELGFSPISTSSDEVRVPRQAVLPIIDNLAINLCSQYSRPVPDSLAITAKSGRDMLYASTIDLTVAYPDTLPKGSGNRTNHYDYIDDRFFPENSEQNY